MYESHFGFSGPPFQLVPDPGFFFGSRGHSNALAFLQSAAQQGDGFLVVTGEIGAGKTTLVRTLIEGLDSNRVMAATLVSTQLESGDLPQAILLAFGVDHKSKTRAQLSARLESYLIQLANQGRRALLIVDEAQNLGLELIEELRLLSNLQLGAAPLLQVFLVGQPDLRTRIQAKAMEQLRQRVTASCHLGPLDPNETQAYVQHRLRRVGWTEKPAIDAAAYPAVHQWTAGIPRRINRLCNRLLLAAFLEAQDVITAQSVDQIAGELRNEIGESDEPQQLQESFVPAKPVPPVPAVTPGAPIGVAKNKVVRRAAPRPLPRPAPIVTVEDEEVDSRFASDAVSDWAKLTGAPAPAALVAATPGRADPEPLATPGAAKREQTIALAPAPIAPAPLPAPPEPSPTARPAASAQPTAAPEQAYAKPAQPSAEARPAATPPAIRPAVVEPLVLLVDSAGEYVKARALGRVLKEAGNLPPVLIVNTGSLSQLEVGDELAGVMPQAAPDVHLDIDEPSGAASAVSAITRFDALLRAHRPKAMLAMGTSDALLMCTLFAHKSAIPVLRNDAGRRRAWSRPGEEMNAVLLEQMADSLYISDLATYYTLYRAGIPTERVLLVGNLADNVQHCAAQHTVDPREILTRAGVSAQTLHGATGYAVCTAQFESARANEDALKLISMLMQVASALPVLWAASAHTRRELEALGQLVGLEKAGIEVMDSLAYLDCIDLLRGARCLISGNAGHFLDDAVSLGIPSIVLGKGIVVPVKSTEALQLSAALPAAQLPSVLADVLAHPTQAREVPLFWDGGAAGRIAAHLAEWLPRQATAGNRSAPNSTPAPHPDRVPHAEVAFEGMTAG
jgi:general secretion pathway protein A